MKKHLIYLFLVLILASVLRMISLGSIPVGFTWDEAALGYNAYSLLKTGKDEHQVVLPVVFESFGDFKPGAYIYFSVPPVFLLGLNEFSTRLPSAIFGVLTVLSLWVFVAKHWGMKFGNAVAFVAAINPWSIYFSRGAWETNVMTFLLLIGSILFIEKKYIRSLIFMGLTFWTYQGAKMLAPLLLFGLWLFFEKKKLDIKKYIWPAIVFLGLLLPILWNFKAQSGRLQVFSVFSYTRPTEVVTAILNQDSATKSSWVYGLFHSEFLDQARGIVQRYLNHYSPRFLFINGDWTSMRQSIAYYGYFHIPEIILLVLGLIYCAGHFDDKTKYIIWWLIVAAIPSALSRDLVSGVRSFPLTVPLLIIIGIGLTSIASKKVLVSLYILSMLFFLPYFLDLYFKQAKYYRAEERLTFYKPAIEIVNRFSDEYQNIIFTNKFGQPYIYVLFFNKVDPRYFWNTVVRSNPHGVDVGEVDSFGKWKFEKYYWPSTRAEKSVIVVGDQFELPEQDLHQPNLYRLGQVTLPDNTPILSVVGLK